MSILERLEHIETRAQIARDSGVLQQSLGRIERAVVRVNDMASSLSKATTAFHELHPVDSTLSELIPKFGQIATALGLLAAKAGSKPQFGALEEFTTELGVNERLLKAIEASLSESWARYQEQNPATSVDRALLTTFENSGLKVDHLIEQFDDASRELAIVAELRLPTSGTVHRHQTSLNKLAAVSEGLTDVVPAALASFFRRADSPDGAPLSSLTNDVVSFLTEHQIIDRYSIRGHR
ncbi:hypothetical protein AAFP30_05770 [Gordonia sp. CPCC 205515]|uniref:hypothetical protein n=1 Tax=Gordonia sp. CPCC 205515 TaxID=3140791 RepID=UPI003AF40783